VSNYRYEILLKGTTVTIIRIYIL